MKGNRRVNTKPELAIRAALHARGLRYRKDYLIRAGSARVKPDLVFTRRRVAVFVDGCFWHSCPDHGTTPQVNTDYWGPKLARNQDRDQQVTESLTASGWRVIRLWEHVSASEAVDRIIAALSADTRQDARVSR
jgi:DNA mismatch endonuclease (patch repair protein)